MLRTEVRRCSKCEKIYIMQSGGIIMNPMDFDFGLCKKCRLQKDINDVKSFFRKIL